MLFPSSCDRRHFWTSFFILDVTLLSYFSELALRYCWGNNQMLMLQLISVFDKM